MLQDGFSRSYTTIPFALYKHEERECEGAVISHNHKELELIAMRSGHAEFCVDSVPYSLGAGDVLVIPPYAVHRAHVSANTAYDCVCFRLSLLWDDALREGLEKGMLTVKEPLTAARPYCAEMNEYVHETVRIKEERLPGWEMEIIGRLSIMFGRLKSDGFFVESGGVNPEHKFVKSVLKYVTDHFAEPITSRTVAEAIHFNNSYFCRLFKRAFGTCFAEYLLGYRIERAKGMLGRGEASISEVALKTGFNSFSYFGKVFREQVGISPSEYRRREAWILP